METDLHSLVGYLLNDLDSQYFHQTI